jgi:hypothetical protein
MPASLPLSIRATKRRKRLEIEETDFVYRVIASSSILLAPEEAVDPDYASGEKIHPAKIYAMDVHSRTIPLVDRVYSLNEIFGLLEVKILPLQLGSYHFSKFEWLRLIIDLIHVRFTSLRDSAILVAAAVLQIDDDPRQIRISTIEKIEGSKKIVATLRKLSAIGLEIRQARDRNFHRSVIDLPALDGFEQHVFSSISKMESWGTRFDTNDSTQVYSRVRGEILREYTRETTKIVSELKRLLDLLDPIFIATQNQKYGRRP